MSEPRKSGITHDRPGHVGWLFTSEHFGKFPRIRILTIEDLLTGKTLQMPPSLERTFKQAERVETDTTDQATLGFDM